MPPPGKEKLEIADRRQELLAGILSFDPEVVDEDTEEGKATMKKKRDHWGRPTVMTAQVLLKIETAFKIGCNIGEAVEFAGICRATLDNFFKKHPDFLEKMNSLRENYLVAFARSNVAQAITQDKSVSVSLDYLRAKRKDEWAGKQIHAVERPVSADELERFDRGDFVEAKAEEVPTTEAAGEAYSLPEGTAAEGNGQ